VNVSQNTPQNHRNTQKLTLFPQKMPVLSLPDHILTLSG